MTPKHCIYKCTNLDLRKKTEGIGCALPPQSTMTIPVFTRNPVFTRIAAG